MEYRKYNNAIATFMDWPFEPTDGEYNGFYEADDLLLVLMKMSTIEWQWKIYLNARHLDQFAVKLWRGPHKHYSYHTNPTTALYNAIGAALTFTV